MQPIKSLLKLLLERNKLKYMLFFHARTGSSTLKKILNTHPKICLYGEPFHNNRFINRENFKRQNKIPKHINTIDDLDIALKELSYKYNGIKQGIHNTNNKFCDHLLLNRNIKIIFLQRTNLLQMVISSLIAQKIQKWGGETKEWRKMVEQQKCEPFDIDFIQKRIQGINKRIQKYKQLLKDNNI
ncbi:hypothetical protein KJ742_05730, partial [Patescibacteria group bacterium]|nr:hypothetical protein [Patescibacteria group bacterium]